MDKDSGASLHEEGPPAYENWKAAIAGTPSQGAREHALFTDAHIVGEQSYGPYRLINTVPQPQTHSLSPVLVLRRELHLAQRPGDLKMDKTDTRRYHGGSLEDEIAALVSLCLGVRLKAGPSVRQFDPGGDPRGRPIAWSVPAKSDPVLVKPAGSLRVLPRVLGKHSLEDTAPLVSFPVFLPGDAVALVRTARLYQDAVWIAESEPELRGYCLCPL